MKTERLYLFLGVTSLVLAIGFLSLGLYGTAVGTPNAPIAGGVCFTVFIVPAFLFLSYWSRKARMEKQLRMLADVLRGYRRLSMEELAGKIDCSEEDAEFLTATCIGRGYVRGRIDSAGRTFISEEPAAEDEKPS